MILKAICDYSDKPFEFMRNRYNQTDEMNYFVKGYSLRSGIDGRFGSSRYQNVKSWRKPEDDDGLVGF